MSDCISRVAIEDLIQTIDRSTIDDLRISGLDATNFSIVCRALSNVKQIRTLSLISRRDSDGLASYDDLEHGHGLHKPFETGGNDPDSTTNTYTYADGLGGRGFMEENLIDFYSEYNLILVVVVVVPFVSSSVPLSYTLTLKKP